MNLSLSYEAKLISQYNIGKVKFPILQLALITVGLLYSLYLNNVALLFLIVFLSLLFKGKELSLFYIFFFSRFYGFGLGSVEDFSSINLFKGITINLGDFAFILLLIILLKKNKKYPNEHPFNLKLINIFVLANVINLILLLFTPLFELKIGYILRLFSSFYFAFLLFYYLQDQNKLTKYLDVVIFSFCMAFVFQILTITGWNLSIMFNLQNFSAQSLKFSQVIVERFRNPLVVFSGSIFFYFLARFVYKNYALIEIIFLVIFILSVLLGLVRRPLVWAAIGFVLISFYPKIIDKRKKIITAYLLIGIVIIILSITNIFDLGLSVFFDRAASIVTAVQKDTDTYLARNIENQKLWSFFISNPLQNIFGALFTRNYTELLNANLLDGDVGILEVLVMYGVLPAIIYVIIFFYSIYYAFKVIKATKKEELKLLAFSIATFMFIFIPFHYNLNNFGYNASGVLILTNNLGLLASIKNIESGKHIEQKN